MKKIILLIVIIVSISYNLKAQIALTGNITTAGVAVYPTHIDSLGRGGLMVMPDLTTRNDIPVKRRKQGMLVYVQANDSLYKLLTADLSNSGWVAMGFLSQQKLTDSLNARLKSIDTLSLSTRIDLKANAGVISDVTSLIANKFKTSDTSFLLQKADTASLSNRINLKTNTVDFTTLTAAVATKFKTTDTSYLLQKSDTASLSNRINLKIETSKIGAKNGVASLNSAGVIPSDQIPPISFSSVDVVNNLTEMLSFTNGTGLSTDRLVGSIVVRLDSSKNFVLARQPASIRSNWTELLTPAPPVQSVNGHLGTVSITPLDLKLDSIDNTRDVDKPISNPTKSALALKLKITDTAYLLQKSDTTSLSNRIFVNGVAITTETSRAAAAETQLTNNITTNTNSITSNTSSIGTINTNVSANTSSITALNTKIISNTASITTNTSDILLRATISSPSFTGTPTAATAIAGTNTTQLATTEFVRSAVTSITGLSNTNLSGNAGITDANLATISAANKVSNSATSATATNTSNTIVARDGIGNFTANSITASLNGTALNATNIVGGTAGSMPYQTASNSTGLLAAGTEGQYLQLTSGLPSWKTLSTTVSSSSITGTLSLLNGGTGQTTIAGIQSALGLTGTTVAIGGAAGQSSQGTSSVAIGAAAGQTLQGSSSVALGYVAGFSNQGNSSVAIGSNAGQVSQAANSVAIGYAASQNSQAANSVSMGAYSVAGYSNSTAIGYGAVSTAANTIQLGADGTNGVGGATTAISNVKTTGTLTAGTVTYPNTHGINGQLLTTTGSGTLTWTAAYAPNDATTTSKGIIQLAGDLRGTVTSPTVNTVGGVNSATISTFDTRITSASNSITSLTSSIWSNTSSITSLTTNSVPYTGATKAVNLGAYDLTVNGLTIGMGSGAASTNTVIGNGAISNINNTGVNNSAMGYNSLKSNTTGLSNTSNGVSSLFTNSSGSYNNANGVSALYWNSSGNYNLANGFTSLLNNTIGSYNTAIGKASLSTNTSGNHNTAVGNMANVLSFNLENATAIGDSAIVAASNSIQLGNTNVINVKTSGTLTLGAVTYPSIHGNIGQVLTTTGSGTLTWTVAYTPIDASTTAKGIIQLAGDLRGTAASPTVNTVGGVNSVTISTFDTRISSATLSLTSEVTRATTAEAANTSSITSNTASINTLNTNVASNTASITSNTASINTLNTNVASNTSSITSNTSSINTLNTNVASNTASITSLNTSILASTITGTVAVAKGGTGQTSIAGIQSAIGLTGANVAIGESAGATTQGTNAIAIGKQTGMSTQGGNSVAIGNQAGKTTQGGLSIAIGPLAGQSNQGANSVAMGYLAGNNYQGANSVALGAGSASAGNSTAVGYYASSGTYSSTALGGYASAGYANSTAIGYQASTSAPNTIQLGADGISIAGSTAITNVKTSGTITAGAITYPNIDGLSGQVLTTTGSGTLTWTVAYTPTDASTTAKGIIQLAGDLRGTATSPTVNTVGGVNSATIATFDTRITSATNSITTSIANLSGSRVAIGTQAGTISQSIDAVAIGTQAGKNTQGTNSVGLGTNAGLNLQGAQSVAIGPYAAQDNQQGFSVAIGYVAGGTSQASASVAIGAGSGSNNQSAGAVALGADAGNTSQGSHGVAIGYLAGNANQGDNSVAIGTNAAQTGQGQNAVAIGISSSSAANFSTAIGPNTAAGFTNSTAIGYQATATAANTIQLGNSSVTSVNTNGAVNAKSFYLNASNAITAAASTTIDLSLSNIFKVSLGTDIGALSFTNTKPGTYIIEFIQGGTYNVTFPTTNWKWAAGLIPIITQTSGKIDIVTLVYDGTYYFASTVQNF